MIAMNAEVELDGRSFADGEVPRRRLRRRRLRVGSVPRPPARRRQPPRARSSRPISPASPASTWCSCSPRSRSPSRRRAARRRRMARPRSARLVLGAVALLQTIPSLALLAFLIALRRHDRRRAGGARAVPLRAAADRAQHARRPAERLAAAWRRRRCRSGMTAAQALRHVELPLAAPTSRRRQDCRGDQRRHGDDRRVHRRRRLRRAHRRRPRASTTARVMLAGALPAARWRCSCRRVRSRRALVARAAAREVARAARLGATRPRCANRAMLFDWLVPALLAVLVVISFRIAAAPAAASNSSARANGGRATRRSDAQRPGNAPGVGAMLSDEPEHALHPAERNCANENE